MVKNLEGFQKIGKFVAMWEVYTIVGNDDGDYDCEDVVAKFKNPYKAAKYCVANHCYGVRMMLYNTYWDLTTTD